MWKNIFSPYFYFILFIYFYLFNFILYNLGLGYSLKKPRKWSQSKIEEKNVTKRMFGLIKTSMPIRIKPDENGK